MSPDNNHNRVRARLGPPGSDLGTIVGRQGTAAILVDTVEMAEELAGLVAQASAEVGDAGGAAGTGDGYGYRAGVAGEVTSFQAGVAHGARPGRVTRPASPAGPVRSASPAHGAGEVAKLLAGVATPPRAGWMRDGEGRPSSPAAERPLVLGVALGIPTATGATTVRVALDLRVAGVAASLARMFTTNVAWVTPDLKALVFACLQLGVPVPARVFSTELAAGLLNQGLHHWRYRCPHPVDERKEMALSESARERRLDARTLHHLFRQYRVPYPTPVDPEVVAERLRRLPAGASLGPAETSGVMADVEAALALRRPLEDDLERCGLLRHLEFEIPAAVELAKIEFRGARVDVEQIRLVRKDAERHARKAAGRLRDLGLHGSPDSPAEVTRFFDALGLAGRFQCRGTETGYSFTLDRMKDLRHGHPAIEALYTHRKYSSLLREPFFRGTCVTSAGCVHPEIDPLGTDTGRPTFRNPNLVGIPKMARPIVRPDGPGLGLAELDFRAQEVFIAAAHYGDPVLLADCNSGDVYIAQVRRFCAHELGTGEDQLDDAALADRRPELRDRMKVLTLAMIYGMALATVAALMRSSIPQAQRLQDRFFARYHCLRAGMERAVVDLELRGYTETVTGLKRFRGRKGPLTAWECRWAVNAPIQGGGACVLKLLLPRLARYLEARGGRVVLPVYDAVVVQFPLDRQRELLAGAEQIMVTAMQELYPATRPRVDVNDADPSCWNKAGGSSPRMRRVSVEE